jgi:hypothetical protein
VAVLRPTAPWDSGLRLRDSRNERSGRQPDHAETFHDVLSSSRRFEPRSSRHLHFSRGVFVQFYPDASTFRQADEAFFDDLALW